MKNDNTIPAVSKTLSMLRFLMKCENGATQIELTKASGASTSTGYRILCTLLKEHWAVRRADGKYEIALDEFKHSESNLWRIRLMKYGQNILNELSEKTQLSAKISVRRLDEQVTILRSESPGPFSITGRKGASFPIAEGSVGAALLISEPAETVERLARQSSESITEKGNPALVQDRIREIHKKGYCLNREVSRWQICAMSIPVYGKDHCEVICALTLLGLDGDFSEDRVTTLKKELDSAALRLLSME